MYILQYCGDQGAAIIPGIETAFEAQSLLVSLSTFEISDGKYWSCSRPTYHTFYKTGCLSVQNMPWRRCHSSSGFSLSQFVLFFMPFQTNWMRMMMMRSDLCVEHWLFSDFLCKLNSHWIRDVLLNH